MTPEQLLQPRYEVIADYPNSGKINVGDILIQDLNYPLCWLTSKNSLGAFSGTESEWFDRYPHIFRKLQWWQHRAPEEMPEYVKIGDEILKVYQHNDGNCANVYNGEHKTSIPYAYLLPATASEYEEYLKSKR